MTKSAQPGRHAAPLLETEVMIQVSGPLARTRVVQRFRNPTEAWLEGVYAFPLPENAAVDRLRMQIGERLVEGEIREREAAQAAYDRARSAGQRASLAEQSRPNLFTTRVANIGPQEEIRIEIEYQQTLAWEEVDGAGRYRLRFPMVVGPRYIPGTALAAPTDPAAATGAPASPPPQPCWCLRSRSGNWARRPGSRARPSSRNS